MSLLHDIAATAVRRLEPETAHALTLRALGAGLGPRPSSLEDPALSVELSGMRLPNCIGLAAGFDKNAEVPDAMLAAGFGMVECGSVTPLAQDGNPRPRLFRLGAERAVINRMGFNNAGLEPFSVRLSARKRRGIVGANLGANKDSADRVGDYVLGLQRLWGLADYFTVNVSSPNTPGLRALQSNEALQELCGRLAEARSALTGVAPVFLKVSPELTETEIRDVVEIATRFRIDGLVICNTTTQRPAGLTSAHKDQSGGLSGAPLRDLALRAMRLFHQAHDDKLALIGVGGIASGADAYARIRAGACAVQLYTALVYEGPGVVQRIKRDLARRLRADGFASIIEARGTA